MPTPHALQQVQLPLLPQTVGELLSRLGTRHARTPDLQRVILRDPAAAVALFRHLHRVRPGAAAMAADIAHAVALVGFSALQELLAGLPTLGEGLPARGRALRLLYGRAAHAAVYAGLCARRRAQANPEALATAALLQNPALLALAELDPEAALRGAGAVRGGVPPEAAYRAELGRDLATCNQDLAAAWGFPDLACQAMEADAARGGGRLIALAARAAWHDGPGRTAAGDLARELRVDADTAAALLSQDMAAAGRELYALGYPVAAFDLVQIPSEEELTVDELTRLDTVLARPPRRAGSEPEPAPPVNPLQQALSGIMRRMLSEAGLERAVFAMLSPDRSRLQARLAVGGRRDDPLRRLDLILERGQLFHSLLGKTQSIWLQPANAAKYLAALPRHWAAEFPHNQLFAMSIVISGRPLGAFYGSAGTLDEAGYRQFRLLCREAAQRLAGDRAAA